MKTFDTFLFYNELDILELRLNILNDYVDYFIIGESIETFRGNTKPLFYEENKKRFSKFNHKIIHCVIGKLGENQDLFKKAIESPNTGIHSKDEWWVREFYQKEYMINSLDSANDQDNIFVSDTDEIWNPNIKIPVLDDTVYRPIQTAYPFYLNNRSNQHYSAWVGTRFGTIKKLKMHGFNHFRTEREVKSIPIAKGGWHFSWQGKKDWNKWNDGHPGNKENYFLLQQTQMKKDESELPQYIINNKEDFIKNNLMLP